MSSRKRIRLLAIIAADALMLAGAWLITLEIGAHFAVRPVVFDPDPITWLGLLLIVGGFYARAYVWTFWNPLNSRALE